MFVWLDAPLIVSSIILNVVLALGPSFILRFSVLKAPWSRWKSIAFCTGLWFLLLVLWDLSNAGRRHGTGVAMAALASYWILRSKSERVYPPGRTLLTALALVVLSLVVIVSLSIYAELNGIKSFMLTYLGM